MTAPRRATDEEILDFLHEVAIEGYETDDEVIRIVAGGLPGHPDEPDLADRVRRLALPLFAELQAREAEWPIPTDNDRLDRAFAALEQDGILARQHWYLTQGAADEEILHEVKAARLSRRPVRGFVFFHAGDTKRAIAGEGLRLTWGTALPRSTGKTKLERTSWELAQDIHRALWAQHLSPAWSRVVGEPITLSFTWRRRRRRRERRWHRRRDPREGS